ncbi:V-type ATP synthase subunit I [Candidatus Woesearchaeota archaeon]|nr:V-type ATP synthase subunit I [Candidatus Woesearchaeota archaeon]
MLRPEPMTKLLFVCPETKLDGVLRLLHEKKVLHISHHQTNSHDNLPEGKASAGAASLASALVKVNALCAQLHLHSSTEELRGKHDMQKLQHHADTVSESVKRLKERVEEIKLLIARKEEQRELLRYLEIMGLSADDFNGSRIKATLGMISPNISVTSALNKVTSRYHCKKHLLEHKDQELIAVLYDREEEAKVEAVLASVGMKQLMFSSIAGFQGSPLPHRRELDRELHDHLKEEKQINEQLQAIGKEHGKNLLALLSILQLEMEIAEAPRLFGVTESCILIRGFLPTHQTKQVVEEIKHITQQAICVYKEEIHHQDNIPVKFQHSAFTKPFQFFLDLYTLPSYHEIDPTSLMAITFPFLFGFMLGDIGYGIVTLLLFWILKKKFSAGKDLFQILIYASVATIIAGLLFGEFFGSEYIFGYHLFHILSREHEIYTLLYLSLGIGVIHVNLALALGFVNELHHHGLYKAICEKLSWVIMEIGAALAVGSMYHYLTIPVYVGIGVAVLGVVLLLLGAGVIGIIEIPGLMGNVLSYARLMALGLASVGLATVVNDFARDFFQKGGFFIAAAILLLILGHGINILLGVMGPFLHSLRLHYVEFFTKFFKGGGTRYKPFGQREIQTE